ncbi:MAG: ABC transporter substrate-binding protein [Candidatus Binatia bacterium]
MGKCFLTAVWFIAIWFWTFQATGIAASASPSLSKAKKQAEAKGYIFVAGKDEIVAKAKKEGRLAVQTFLEGDAKKAMTDAFKKKYPFIQISADNIGGVDEYRRFVPEMKLGRARYDTVHISNQVYAEYPPYLKKFDILGMAEQNVLAIPPKVVDSNHRTIVAKGTQVAVAAYNKKLIGAGKVPTQWENFLKPELKGRKFVADIRPLSIANLVPIWGIEKTLEFARKLAAQKPVWNRGSTRILTSLAAGEYPLVIGVNLGSAMDVQAKDPTKNLQYQILEPVPVRFGAADGILKTASHPHAGLLWLEFQLSNEGQDILDRYGPADGSAFIPGSIQGKMLRGKTLSVLSWDLHDNLDEWSKKIVEAYGFPVAEKR